MLVRFSTVRGPPELVTGGSQVPHGSPPNPVDNSLWGSQMIHSLSPCASPSQSLLPLRRHADTQQAQPRLQYGGQEGDMQIMDVE